MPNVGRLAGILIGVGLGSLAVKQGIAISEHGVDGWLKGEAGYQTEWEVRAVVGLLVVAAAASIIGLAYVAFPVGEKLFTWRLTRAAKRGRRRQD